MRHHLFAEATSYPVALLIKGSSFAKHELVRNYVEPLQNLGVPQQQQIAFTLQYNEAGKAPASYIKEYLSRLLPALDKLGTQLLYVADGTYFKTLTGVTKSEPHHGYVLPCKIKGFEHLKVVLGINYQALIYNPDLQAKLDRSLETVAAVLQGSYQAPGSGIIHSAHYPESLDEIRAALAGLHQYPALTIDIEAFSLDFDKAGIGTIAMAWDQHHGIAFACDYAPTILADGKFHPDCPEESSHNHHGFFKVSPAVRALIKEFLTTYKGRVTWHNATYDVKVIIYNLWMNDLLDTPGLLDGLHLLCRNMDDSKIIAYLATNSTAGNVLGLKPLAHEFAGNWAQDDIKDIRKIPLDKLLQYNLVDCLSTWFVKTKYTPIMQADNQENLYHTLMLPSLKTIIQIELTGMPMNQAMVAKVKAKLEADRDVHLKVLNDSPTIKVLNLLVQDQAWTKDYEDRRAKAKNPGKILPKQRVVFDNISFNPNSGPQLIKLLYDQMGLPVIDVTDTKLPATGADTLEKLIHHTQVPEYIAIMEALIGYGKIAKILSAFIPAFEQAILKSDGFTYLHGSFNLGGTVSGRLSSSDPNLQNIPAGSTYGKLIKLCFEAVTGWLFCGADFNSLEDYISALTTKDPAKLDVYLKGFDGHSLRAAYYFREDLLAEGIHIALDDPTSVNQLKKNDHPLRQESKAPTFALTYQGTWITLVRNLGWSEEKAKAIEANYHELYKVSDEYIAKRIAQAAQDGYVEVAFGLRVRTPLLGQTILGTRSTPYEAAAEGRTAGNAMGQSYGLLNNRAANAFMERVWASEFKYDVRPVALIHDAIYLLIRDDVRVVEWVNRELITAMQWQELPEIQHDQVKLGAALDIFWPNWSQSVTLPNGADQETIRAMCEAHITETKEAV